MKKSLTQKLLALILSAVVFTAFTGVTVFAETSPSTDVDGDLSINEGAKPYIASAKDNQLVQEKLSKVNSSIRANSVSGSDNWYCILPVTVFKQTNNYYCGPATTKQVLHYINGTSLSQSTYAGELGTTQNGTTMTKIDDVLNKHQTRNRYTYSEFNSYSEWEQRVQYGMIYLSPPVIDINSQNNSHWRYTTSGHYMCISGYTTESDKTYTRVADPHYIYAGTYKYEASVVYAVNKAHWRHAIIF